MHRIPPYFTGGVKTLIRTEIFHHRMKLSTQSNFVLYAFAVTFPSSPENHECLYKPLCRVYDEIYQWISDNFGLLDHKSG